MSSIQNRIVLCGGSSLIGPSGSWLSNLLLHLRDLASLCVAKTYLDIRSKRKGHLEQGKCIKV